MNRIKAIYEDGVFKPSEKLPLTEHQEVTLAIFIDGEEARLAEEGIGEWDELLRQEDSL